MRKWMVIISCASLCCGVQAQLPVAIPLVTKKAMTEGLLAQQRYTADVAAAAFVAMQHMMDAALTNQLLSAAVLYAYTNALDAADSQQYAESIAKYQRNTTRMLDEFLRLQQALNDELRVVVAEEARLAAQVGAMTSVARYAPGLITEDSTEPILLVANQTHHAWRPAGWAPAKSPILRIGHTVSSEVPTRFTASVLLYHEGDISVETVDGTSVLRLGSQPSGWTLIDIDQYSSTMYVVKFTEVK